MLCVVLEDMACIFDNTEHYKIDRVHAWRLYWLLAIACWVSDWGSTTSASAERSEEGTRSGSCSTVQLWEATKWLCSLRKPSPVPAACNLLLHPPSAERHHFRHHFQHECDGGGGGDDGDGGDADDVSWGTNPTPITRCRIASFGDDACDDGDGASDNCFPCATKKLL